MKKVRYWINSVFIGRENCFGLGSARREGIAFGWGFWLICLALCALCALAAMQYSAGNLFNFPGSFGAENIYWKQICGVKELKEGLSQNFALTLLKSVLGLMPSDKELFYGSSWLQTFVSSPLAALLGSSLSSRFLCFAAVLLNGAAAGLLLSLSSRSRTAVIFSVILTALNPFSLKALALLDYSSALIAPALMIWYFALIICTSKKSEKYSAALFISAVLCALLSWKQFLGIMLLICCSAYINRLENSDSWSKICGICRGKFFWLSCIFIFWAVLKGIFIDPNAEAASGFFFSFFYSAVFCALLISASLLSMHKMSSLCRFMLAVCVLSALGGALSASAYAFFCILSAASMCTALCEVLSVLSLEKRTYFMICAYICAAVSLYASYQAGIFPVRGFNSQQAPFYWLLAQESADAGKKSLIELPDCPLPVYNLASCTHGYSIANLQDKNNESEFSRFLSDFGSIELNKSKAYADLLSNPEDVKRGCSILFKNGCRFIILHERVCNMLAPGKGSVLYDKDFTMLCSLLGPASAEDYEPVSKWQWGSLPGEKRNIVWYRMSVFSLTGSQEEKSK